jgi:hypothetical protein
METLDEMLGRHLLTPEQHAGIAAWVAAGRTPEAIMAMPPHLWRALTLASALMNIDADLTQPPPLGRDGPL